MSSGTAFAVLERLSAVADELLGLDLGGLNDDEFLDWITEIETSRRRLQAVDHQIVAEVGVRDLTERHLARNPAGLLGQVWRISGPEANRRVAEAAVLSPRVALSGEPLEPIRPIVAAARRAGEVGAEQAQVICRALDAIPATLPVDEVAEFERLLVEHATRWARPLDLQRLGERILAGVNPDGDLPSEDEQGRRRFLNLTPAYDGMVDIRGRLDAETGAKALAVLAALAAPRPADAMGRDERTGGQRTHDAFADIVGLAMRADEVKMGSKPTRMLHVFMTATQFETGTGIAHTTFGQRLHVKQALRLTGEASIAWVVHRSKGTILNHGRKKRFATARQVEALIARDQGCAFPGCDMPPEFCDRHHEPAFEHGGRTDLNHMALLCGYHHDKYIQQGWRMQIIDGLPHFIPPKAIDPEQKPIPSLRPLMA